MKSSCQKNYPYYPGWLYNSGTARREARLEKGIGKNECRCSRSTITHMDGFVAATLMLFPEVLAILSSGTFYISLASIPIHDPILSNGAGGILEF